MSLSGRRQSWSAAFAVGLLWVIVSAIASSAFLLIGAVIYALALAACIAADARSRPED